METGAKQMTPYEELRTQIAHKDATYIKIIHTLLDMLKAHLKADANFPRGTLADSQFQHAMALYASLPQNPNSAETIITKVAASAYTNGIQDAHTTRGVQWDRFPGWLIDHHEGDAITEEILQSALAAMLEKHPPVHPFSFPPGATLYVSLQDGKTDALVLDALKSAKSLLEELPAHEIAGTRTSATYIEVCAALRVNQESGNG